MAVLFSKLYSKQFTYTMKLQSELYLKSQVKNLFELFWLKLGRQVTELISNKQRKTVY